jgi:hypothetical protein
MSADPCALEVAVPVLLTDATPIFEDCQVAEAVTSCLLPSVKMAVALKIWVVPLGMAADVGSTCRDWRAAFPTVAFSDPEIVPLVAVMLKLPLDTLCTNPDTFTEATVAGVLLQLTEFVTFADVPSV